MFDREKSIIQFLIDPFDQFVCWVKRNRIVNPKNQVVKVNIGSGLSVASGWINIDASLNAFFSKWPRFVLTIFYKISGSRHSYSLQEYCDILKKHIFVHHDVKYGLPFPEESVDCLYLSHFLEHLFNCLFYSFYRDIQVRGQFQVRTQWERTSLLLFDIGSRSCQFLLMPSNTLLHHQMCRRIAYPEKRGYLIDPSLPSLLHLSAQMSQVQ